jgi:hypothetical protein
MKKRREGINTEKVRMRKKERLKGKLRKAR